MTVNQHKKSKLLIMTQIVDAEDTSLGFMHSWIERFAKDWESIVVICLKAGKYNLPANVKILSLGKEHNLKKISLLKNFLIYIWKERNKYESVFVHMNQEYVLIAGLWWRAIGKKVYMWRNHYAGTLLTKLAIFISNVVFCTSEYSFTAKYKKTIIMPVGIDTEFFKPDKDNLKLEKSILFLGRIAPSKNIDLLIESLNVLKKGGGVFKCSIYGNYLDKDKDYYESLLQKIRDFNLDKDISFMGGIAFKDLPEVYNKHKVSINLSKSGMFDKTMFESMACGTPLIACNKSLQDHIDPIFLFKESDVNDLASKIKSILSMNGENYSKYVTAQRDYVSASHGLDSLSNKLKDIMSI